MIVLLALLNDGAILSIAWDNVKESARPEAWNMRRTLGVATVLGIMGDGQVAGSVLSYEESEKPEVSYWIGKEFWGKGIATWALSEFLARVNKVRPIYARSAKDNAGSLRVLEKCGFVITGEDKGFANARGQEVEEFILTLTS